MFRVPIVACWCLLSLAIKCSAQSYAGDTCRLSSTSTLGVCILAQNCPEAFSNGRRPDLCSYSGNNAIVCCPRQTRTTTRSPQGHNGRRQVQEGGSLRISQMKCQEYSHLAMKKFSVSPLVLDPETFDFEVPNCDFTTPLIVDGEKSKPGEYPHMAAVGWDVDGVIEFNCGGVLISDEYVVTAAHCADRRNPPIFVRLGDQNLVRFDDNAEPIEYGIAQIIIHPQYQKPRNYNDIALLRLSSKVQFTKFVRPACLWPHTYINHTQAIATGWGLVEFQSDKSDELLKVPLNMYSNKECNQAYETSRKIPNGIIDSQLCAGNRGGHQDTCQGDSGGPLQVVNPGNNCIFFVIGLTSFGKSCGLSNNPGVYTRITAYLDWIEEVAWNN